MTETADSLVAYCRENGRVCPLPQRWQAFWEMLPGAKKDEEGKKPGVPLILGAWHYTSNLDKMLRVAEHIKWAESHNKLNEVSKFLRNLSEQEWHHLHD